MTKVKNTKQYRQGDLLFIKCDSFGENIENVHGLTILKSSVTGHSHSLTAGGVYLHTPTLYDPASFYVLAPSGTRVVHEEHRDIPLEEGIYKVVRQREVNGYVKD